METAAGTVQRDGVSWAHVPLGSARLALVTQLGPPSAGNRRAAGRGAAVVVLAAALTAWWWTRAQG